MGFGGKKRGRMQRVRPAILNFVQRFVQHDFGNGAQSLYIPPDLKFRRISITEIQATSANPSLDRTRAENKITWDLVVRKEDECRE